MKLENSGRIGAKPERLRRGHDRENNPGAQHGPDQHPGNGELGLPDFLAQGRGLLEAREREQTERKPHGDRRDTDTGCRDEKIPQRRVSLRPVPLMHQHQHRAGHQQHGNDGNALENEQHQAGAARRNDAQRPDHQGGHHRQAEARRVAPEIDPLQEIGAKQTEGAETDDREAEIGAEQRPSGNQPGTGTENRRHEPVGGARIGMVTRQSREAPCHQQHDNGREREDERNHPADMRGRLLRIQIHRQGGSHPGDGDRDSVPGADTLEQDDRRIDRRTILHTMKLACGCSCVEIRNKNPLLLKREPHFVFEPMIHQQARWAPSPIGRGVG